MKGMHKGFTLVEMILVLLIIGIVSAIVIPNLTQQIGEQEYKVAWGKAYSDFKSATRLILHENQGTFTNLFTDSNTMRATFLEQLDSVRQCDGVNSLGNCWSTQGSKLNRTQYVWNTSNTSYAVLANGYMVAFKYIDGACTNTDESGSVAKCGTITVDTNGMKKPNTWGKDVYALYVVPKGVVPYGSTGDIYTNDPNLSCRRENSSHVDNTGYGCAAKFLYD